MYFERLFKLKYVLLSSVVFMLFILVVLPYMSGLVENAVGLISSPDSSFFYTGSDLYAMASEFGVMGRRTYIFHRFTFDIVWPLVYGMFMYTIIGYSLKKVTVLRKYIFLLYIPVIAVVLDYFENVFASIVFARFPKETLVVAQMTPIFTMLKWFFVGTGMVFTMIALVIVVLDFIMKKADN